MTNNFQIILGIPRVFQGVVFNYERVNKKNHMLDSRRWIFKFMIIIIPDNY